jgi:glyoxylase-like metal-dependent hydrolase (beta-lactamase superfamily II)
VLRDGDEVGGFAVLDVPGHSVGHVAIWRERDRVLILGDVINALSLLTTRPGIQEPPEHFTPDPVSNRLAIRRSAALEPRVVLAGHARQSPTRRPFRPSPRHCLRRDARSLGVSKPSRNDPSPGLA